MAVKRYNGSSWDVVAGVGAQGASSTITTWVKTAAGGETSLSGNDDSSQSLSYTIGQELVFINGSLLKRGSDYTATSGTSITGLTALAANDVATVWSNNAFSVTNAISNTLVDAKGDILIGTAADTPGRLAVGTDGQVLTAASTTGTGLTWATPASGSTFAGCALYKSGNQSISNATDTIVTFDSELFDTDGFHSTATNTGRITIPSGKGGYYNFCVYVVWPDGSWAISNAVLKKNGTTIKCDWLNVGSGTYNTQGFATIVSASVGDYFEIIVYHNKGSNNNILGDNNGTGATRFECSYIGA